MIGQDLAAAAAALTLFGIAHLIRTAWRRFVTDIDALEHPDQ